MSFPRANAKMEIARDQKSEVTNQRSEIDREPALRDSPSRSGGPQAAEDFAKAPFPDSRAFTLIELLVVITIIVVLMGLLFPAFRGVQDQAKKTQAKNDLTQIVTAVNAYYTEYGKYPLATADTIYTGTSNGDLFNILRAQNPIENPRQIAFISPPDVKDAANPRSGIGTTTFPGQFFDPWGSTYNIKIDGDYDNSLENPYGANGNAGAAIQRLGVIAWSLGKDKAPDPDIRAGDDVISWQ